MKSNFLVVFISWIVLLTLASCGGEKSSSTSSAEPTKAKVETPVAAAAETPAQDNKKGRLIFKQYCVICHGADGKLGVSNAKDLSVSVLSLEERIEQITNGKGLMTPYKDILSADQIEAVALYLEELRK